MELLVSLPTELIIRGLDLRDSGSSTALRSIRTLEGPNCAMDELEAAGHPADDLAELTDDEAALLALTRDVADLLLGDAVTLLASLGALTSFSPPGEAAAARCHCRSASASARKSRLEDHDQKKLSER